MLATQTGVPRPAELAQPRSLLETHILRGHKEDLLNQAVHFSKIFRGFTENPLQLVKPCASSQAKHDFFKESFSNAPLPQFHKISTQDLGFEFSFIPLTTLSLNLNLPDHPGRAKEPRVRDTPHQLDQDPGMNIFFHRHSSTHTLVFPASHRVVEPLL